MIRHFKYKLLKLEVEIFSDFSVENWKDVCFSCLRDLKTSSSSSTVINVDVR